MINISFEIKHSTESADITAYMYKIQSN